MATGTLSGWLTAQYGRQRTAAHSKSEKFANRLNGRFNLPVELQDERLTTVSAKAEIFERGGYKALKKIKWIRFPPA